MTKAAPGFYKKAANGKANHWSAKNAGGHRPGETENQRQEAGVRPG